MLRFCFLALSIFGIGLALPDMTIGQTQTLEYVIAQDGDDTATGSFTAPFATLTRARNAVREMKDSGEFPEGGAVITLRGGTYRLSETFRLDERDSGTETGRLIIRAFPGEEVRLIGGEILDSGSSRQATPDEASGLSQADSVVVFDLPALGITDFGTHVQYGHGQPVVPAPLELFFNREAMQLARYPNDASMLIGEVIDPGSNPRWRDYSNRGATFKYTDDRHERWAGLEDV